MPSVSVGLTKWREMIEKNKIAWYEIEMTWNRTKRNETTWHEMIDWLNEWTNERQMKEWHESEWIKGCYFFGACVFFSIFGVFFWILCPCFFVFSAFPCFFACLFSFKIIIVHDRFWYIMIDWKERRKNKKRKREKKQKKERNKERKKEGKKERRKDG